MKPVEAGDRVDSVAEPTRLSYVSVYLSFYRSSRSGIAISSASRISSGSAMTDARNLHDGTKAVALGAFKPLVRFDWNHPRSVGRALQGHVVELGFHVEKMSRSAARSRSSRRPLAGGSGRQGRARQATGAST